MRPARLRVWPAGEGLGILHRGMVKGPKRVNMKTPLARPENQVGPHGKIHFNKRFIFPSDPSAESVAEVDAPLMNPLLIDGRRDSTRTPTYADAIVALYAASGVLKLIFKKVALLPSSWEPRIGKVRMGNEVNDMPWAVRVGLY